MTNSTFAARAAARNKRIDPEAADAKNDDGEEEPEEAPPVKKRTAKKTAVKKP